MPVRERMDDAPRRERLDDRIARGGNYFASAKEDVDFISSGCKTLDLALGGGWAENRFANIIGDSSTGKTLLCIEASANFVLKHRRSKVRYREAEHAWDDDYAKAIGMPMDNVDFGEPLETVEDLFEDLEAVTNAARAPELYIVDSLDALSDRGELKRNIDKGSYGAEKAKMMSKMFRQLVGPMERAQVTLIIVSQVRDKIGVMYGPKTTRSGGKALNFYASQIVGLQKLGSIKREITIDGKKVERVVGVDIRARLDKNKVGLPFREAEFPIMFGYGIDDVSSCLALAKDYGVLEKVLDNQKEQAFKKMLAEQHRPEIVKRMHDIIEKRWYEIETKFLPPRSKYGN